MPEFKPFPKIVRLEKYLSGMTITEKIDGTNAAVVIEKYQSDNPDAAQKALRIWQDDDGIFWAMYAQSRTRILDTTKNGDNFGFAKWVYAHAGQLRKLGHGTHYGEWWGKGIQRGYDQDEKRFSLFNVHRPADTLPDCVDQVPVLYRGEFSATVAHEVQLELIETGSVAAPGYDDPEGVMLWLSGPRCYVKHPIKKGRKGDKNADTRPRCEDGKHEFKMDADTCLKCPEPYVPIIDGGYVMNDDPLADETSKAFTEDEREQIRQIEYDGS